MDLVVGTLVLRPYVFAFALGFLVAGWRDLGLRRTFVFRAWVWAVAWLAEFSSTRTGFPFGLYQYTTASRGQELFLADVPLMDSLSFTFLAYAAFCLARVTCRWPGRVRLALTAALLMMLLDVVIDPAAVRGDQWFLGHVFDYVEGGFYFGVPLSNFVGWPLVGTVSVGGNLWLTGAPAPSPLPWPGVALYYAVLIFNLTVTAWIGEWWLLLAGVAVHAVTGLVMLNVGRGARRPASYPIEREVQRA